MRKLVINILFLLLFVILCTIGSTNKVFAGNCTITSVTPNTVCSTFSGSLLINLKNACSPTNQYRVCAYYLTNHGGIQQGGGQHFCENNNSGNGVIITNVTSTGTVIPFAFDFNGQNQQSSNMWQTGDTWQAEVCACQSADCSNVDCSGNPNQVQHINIDDKTGTCNTSAIPGVPNYPSFNICPNNTCTTAIGNVKTDTGSVVLLVFNFVLSLSGIIAVLLIIYSGYRLMTARNNPQIIDGAKETLISAIVGLLFIVFSVLILTTLGVDILQIPGITK